MTRYATASERDDALKSVRVRILEIIELNPHSYESLRSYQIAVRREREIVAQEVAAFRARARS